MGSQFNAFICKILIDEKAFFSYDSFHQATMRFDSTPPALMDVVTSVFDLSDGGPLLTKKHMEQIALKLGEKTLEDKLELTDNLSSALETNNAVFTTPKPTTVVLKAKAAAIRLKLVDISDAEAALTALKSELAAMETDLDVNLTVEASYIQNTTQGAADQLALLPLELKGHGTVTTAPGPIIGFRLSPGVNPGDIILDSKPAAGAVSYEHRQIPDITKPDVTFRLEGSSGCRTVLTGFPSGNHIWVQRRALGGKKTGFGPWCNPSVVTVP